MKRTLEAKGGARRAARAGGTGGVASGTGGAAGGGGVWLRLRAAPRAVAGAARADFAAWVERNFFSPRAGRIGGVSYARAGELDDALREARRRPEDRWDGRALWYASAYERALLDHVEPLRREELGFLLRSPHVALQLALGVTDLRGLRCLRRGLALEAERLQRKACRARYYARDNARRRALAAERRRLARRTTANPCPTPEALRAAFAARGESPEAKVRLGSLLEDLACHVDSRLRVGPCGEVLGRNGGIKAWLRAHAPELACRYKTLMRHKALARRLRQAAGVADPVPADALLPAEAAPVAAPPARACEGRAAPPARPGRAAPLVPERARRVAGRILRKCPNTFAALFRAVDAALDDG